ncbi:MAG: sugar phosphate isomerase/epimerase family protein [Bryobacteraceae bacterium]
MSRREFSKTATRSAGIGLLSASELELRANPLGLPIGCQTYPVRKGIAQDFPGTLKQLSAAGFQAVELCSPAGYADFAGLANYKPAELQRALGDNNLHCVSAHFNMDELRKDLPGRIEWAKTLGLTQMVVPSLHGPRNPTMDDVKRAADEYNRMAEQSATAGIQQGLHNEEFELSTVDGKRTYDVLFELLDPKLVKFQFQVSTVSRGYDAAEYFTKYPGRFISMHAQGWSAKTREITAVGQGTLDWHRIFEAAKIGGIKNYYVEMDLDKMRASVPYLRSL